MYLHKQPHYIDTVWNVNADRMQSCAGCVQREKGFMRCYKVIFYGHVFHKVVNVAREGLNLWRCGRSLIADKNTAIQRMCQRCHMYLYDHFTLSTMYDIFMTWSKAPKKELRVFTPQAAVPFVSKSIVEGWKNTLEPNISTTLYDLWWRNVSRKLKNTQKREG